MQGTPQERIHGPIRFSSLLLLQEASRYTETQAAYQHHVQEFGPDDFFSISKHARQHIPDMSARDILAYMRFSFYDAHLLAFYLPRLLTLIPDLDTNERDALRDTVDNVWEVYFPLGEARDLASDIGCVLYALDDYARALTYFERSVEMYGEHTGTLYNMALCHHLLDQPEQADALLRTVLQHDPEHQQARALLEGGTAEMHHVPALSPLAPLSATASQAVASLPPPAYGIDFVDRVHPSVRLQRRSPR